MESAPIPSFSKKSFASGSASMIGWNSAGRIILVEGICILYNCFFFRLTANGIYQYKSSDISASFRHLTRGAFIFCRLSEKDLSGPSSSADNLASFALFRRDGKMSWANRATTSITSNSRLSSFWKKSVSNPFFREQSRKRIYSRWLCLRPK